jgi:hypothetical protein
LILLGGELFSGLADLLDRDVHLVGGRFLLLRGQYRLFEHHRGGCHQLADLSGLVGALLGRDDRRVRLVLDAGDDHADRVRRVHRALGEFPYLGRDHGESAAGLARPGRLDGGIEREQVGLRGDVVD